MKITVQHVEALRFQAAVGEHVVAVDAAVGEGETSSAMSPPQLFATAMGACMLEFIANSCRLREIPFERLSLELMCEELDRPRRLGPLEATLTIEPQPPEDVRRRLIGVAQHATLVNTLSHVQRAFERPIVAIAGGTHLVNADPDHLRHVGQVLLEMETLRRVYLNHCSGEVAFYAQLSALGPDVVRPCPAGTQLGLEVLS